MKVEVVHDSFDTYLARPEISRGRIVRELELSSKAAELGEQEATDAMKLGSAAHCAVLEPDRFSQQYNFFKGRRAGKEWEAFKADYEFPDKILTLAEYAYCHELGAAMRKSRKFQVAIKGCDFETSIYWDGLKARLDASRKGVIVDLKTTRDISDDGIERALNLSNMVQIPHYLEAKAAAEGSPIDWTKIESFDGCPAFIFAFVSKTLPIEDRLVEVPFEPVKQAAIMRHHAIQQIRDNRKRGIFPSYPNRVETFSPKPYIFK